MSKLRLNHFICELSVNCTRMYVRGNIVKFNELLLCCEWINWNNFFNSSLLQLVMASITITKFFLWKLPLRPLLFRINSAIKKGPTTRPLRPFVKLSLWGISLPSRGQRTKIFYTSPRLTKHRAPSTVFR